MPCKGFELGGVAPEDIGAPDIVINNYRGVEIEDNIVAPKYNLRPPEYQSLVHT